MARRSLAGLLGVVLVAALAVSIGPDPAHAAVQPRTIPALREWTAGTGAYTYGATTRVVLDPAYQWDTTGAVVADDLQALTGMRPAVVSGTESSTVTADLYLTLGSPDTALGQEGYRLEVGPAVKIRARTTAGAFYGTRSVLQLLRQSSTIPGGVARDGPTYAERGILVDTAPRKFSQLWWRNLIRDLSYLKLNSLVVWLNGLGLSDAEIADISTLSARYHVEVAGGANLPGHAEWLLSRYPQYALDPNGPPPASGSIDFTKAGALGVIQQEVESRISSFPGRSWHTGGDEFIGYPQKPPRWSSYPWLADFARTQTGNPNATAEDAYVWFLNWMNGIVRAHGKTMRVWNDTLQSSGVLTLDKTVIVEHWHTQNDPNGILATQYVDPNDRNGGHQLLNANISFTYYTHNSSSYLDPVKIYEQLQVGKFHDSSVSGPNLANVLGSRIQLWPDVAPGKRAQTDDEIAGYLFAPLRSLAQVVWDSPKLWASYGADGQNFNGLTRALGRAPGYRVSTATTGPGFGAGLALEVNGEAAVALVRSDGAVHHAWQAIPGEGPWKCETFPTVVLHDIAENPVLARYGDGTSTLVGRRRDGMLVQATQFVAGTGPWHYRELGRVAAGRPAILVDRLGQLTLSAKLSGGGVLFGRESGPRGPWTFSQVGSGAAGNPSMALDVNGRITITGRNTAGTLYHIWQNVPSQDTWTQETIGLPGIAGDIGVASDRFGNLGYFARATSGSIQHGRQSNPGTGPWTYTTVGPGGAASEPAALLDVNGRLIYFVRTASGQLQTGWETTPGSRTWTIETLASGLTGNLSVMNDVAGRVIYFARDNSGLLRHGWQTWPGSGPWDSAQLPLTC